MKLSQRLETLIQMVPPSDLVLDVGCDHGYVSIELIQREIAGFVIASDLRPGPLRAAESHIEEAGLSGRIRTECCDGIPKDFYESSGDGTRKNVTCLIAGMGGILIGDILKKGRKELNQIRTFIFSPQSDWKLFRTTCVSLGLAIESEDMVEEDGKYYLMIRTAHADDVKYRKQELLYGPDLLKKRHPVLQQYLIRRNTVLEGILDNLKQSDSPESRKRIAELTDELNVLEETLNRMGNTR